MVDPVKFASQLLASPPLCKNNFKAFFVLSPKLGDPPPPPVIVTIRDDKDYVRVLLSCYYATITGGGSPKPKTLDPENPPSLKP